MIKIGYFGTPFYSVKLLEELYKKYEIAFVVTNIDKPVGRKKILTSPPVKEFAVSKSIPVFQFKTLNEKTAIDSINSISTDLNIVFAFGSLIPRVIFDHALCGTVNLHTSFLPKFRGASPVESAILAGDKTTGISLQYITEKLDAGDIIRASEVEISDTDDGETLLEKLTDLGIREILLLLAEFTNKRFDATPQNHLLATHCSKILPEHRMIDFTRSSVDIFNQIRAFFPFHTAYGNFRDKRLNILKARIYNGKIDELKGTGTLYLVDKKTLVVECGDGGLLELIIIQPENKNKMTSNEFMNGYRLQKGEKIN